MKRICLGIVFFCLLVAGATQPQQKSFVSPVPVGKFLTVTVEWNWHGNLFNLTYENMWYETLLIQFNNGDIATLTGYFETTIPVSASYFAYMCNYYGKEINEVTILIHNHPRPSRFSQGDIKFFENLKRRGFQGLYLLHTPGRVIYQYLGDHEIRKLKPMWKKEKENDR